ncbi:glycoside hydrolase family 3 protein [Robiginitalea sp. SC105]|uniref:glycoside hydrolase family 3 protein n=1 Tax=Robiginitalea sp. SC105 TaxID=2762332 RepID=UPI00163AFCC3|nr:glycoside hydrolase family 3 N-terminal domain-containing protein [Robiginitalea sp. SC105]MBC2839250.1 glycoside hydrolase family 3 protein [Robiginitalea sp. SC105]
MPEFPTSSQMQDRTTLEERVGQLFMPAAFINDTEEAIGRLERLIRDYHIGGLCFFHSPASAATNFEGEKEIPKNPDSLGNLKSLIRRYQAAASHPLLIAMDAEWGLAMRIENGEGYPYALCLGALEPGDPLIYQTGLRMAADCREAGIHWNLAPVADVNNNAANPVIGYRAFGTDPEAVAHRATELFRGLRNGGILGCAKHFPGHGDTGVDSHLALPVIDKTAEALDQVELAPFRSLIAAGADAVMTGHLSVPALDPSGMPASLSAAIIQGTLRGKLGFEGPVISDALNMHAVSKMFPELGEVAWRAFAAGNDMLCFAEDIPLAHKRICKEGDRGKIDMAFARIWGLKERVYSENTRPIQPDFSPAGLREELAARCLTAVRATGAPPERFASDGDTTLVCAGDMAEVFLHGLKGVVKRPPLHWGWTDTREAGYPIPATKKVLLALTPPRVKPANSFGMPPAALEAIRELCKNREVWLCHFGNPYALDLFNLEPLAGILLAYQPTTEFQGRAAAYFKGDAPAPGRLPIPLKTLKLRKP